MRYCRFMRHLETSHSKGDLFPIVINCQGFDNILDIKLQILEESIAYQHGWCFE